MGPNLSNKVRDRMIESTVLVSRMDAALRRRVLRELRDAEDKVQSTIVQLRRASAAPGRARDAERLVKQLRKIVADAHQSIGKTAGSELISIGLFAHEKALEAYNVSIGADLFSAMTPADVRQIGRKALTTGAPFREWLNNQSQTMQTRLSSVARQGVLLGETNEQIVKRAAALNIGKGHELQSLVRTAVASVNNEVIFETLQENADLLKGVQALNTLDLRTSLICIARGGGVWDLATGRALPGSPTQEPFPGPPPWHFNCRTILIAVTKSWEQLTEELTGRKKKILDTVPNSTRASMNGEVAGNVETQAWFEASPNRARASLGPARFDLWKEKKITLPQLLDQSGRPVTVQALRQQTASAGTKQAYEAMSFPHRFDRIPAVFSATSTRDLYSVLDDHDLGHVALRLDDADLSTSQDVVNTLANWSKRVRPEDRKFLSMVRLDVKTFANEKDSFARVGWTNAITGEKEILLNPRYFGKGQRAKFDAVLREEIDKKWLVDTQGNAVEALLTHELGHVMEIRALTASSDITSAGVQAAREYVRRNPALALLDQPLEVSRYAATNLDEAFAEAYSKVMLTGPDEWTDWERGFAEALGILERAL